MGAVAAPVSAGSESTPILLYYAVLTHVVAVWIIIAVVIIDVVVGLITLLLLFDITFL